MHTQRINTCRCCGTGPREATWSDTNLPPGVNTGDTVEVCGRGKLFCPTDPDNKHDGLIAAKDNSDIQHYLDTKPRFR